MASSATSQELPKMSLLQHLEELRKRIIVSVLAVIGGFLACWWKADVIYGYMQRPISQALTAHHLDTQLVYTAPTEPFNIYMKVGLIAGIFIASPIVLYQLWLFISPGLFRNEKRYVLPFMSSTVLLFLAGGAFGYFIAYPAMLKFLLEYPGTQFRPLITVTEYTDLFLTIILGLGIVFEMPIVIFFLALMGIVDAGWLWRNLRYSILIIFIIAAIVTPTTDILNMCIFATPMIALYVLSVGVAWLVHPKRRKAREAKDHA
jgi:sec-independent protein translocase protein TatC